MTGSPAAPGEGREEKLENSRRIGDSHDMVHLVEKGVCETVEVLGGALRQQLMQLLLLLHLLSFQGGGHQSPIGEWHKHMPSPSAPHSMLEWPSEEDHGCGRGHQCCTQTAVSDSDGDGLVLM